MLRSCICCALLIALSLPGWADDTPSKALEPLQGSWLVKNVQRGGQPQQNLAQAVLTFTQDKVRLNDNELGNVVVDASSQPQLIDFLVGGTDAPQTVEGIFQVEGDQLQICVRVEDIKNRPTAFETGEDGNLILLTLERKKP